MSTADRQAEYPITNTDSRWGGLTVTFLDGNGWTTRLIFNLALLQ